MRIEIGAAMAPGGVRLFENQGAGWLNAISDGVIGLSCLAILLLLARVARQRRDLHMRWLTAAVAMFLLAVAATHLVLVWTSWKPDYWLEGAVKAVACVSSVVAAALLLPLLPGLLKLPGRSDVTSMDHALGFEIAGRKKAEDELRDRTGEVRFFADSMPHIAWTAGPDGTVSYFNSRWHDYCGSSAESRNWREHVHPDDLAEASRVWQPDAGVADPVQAEARIRARDGVWRPHRLLALARRDADGKVAAWAGSAIPLDVLPRPEEPARTRPAAVAAAQETVLVVENAPVIMRMIRNILTEQGYRVLEAVSAEEAMHALEEHGKDIHVLLAEMALPQGSGLELARHFAEREPAIRALFMAGQSDSEAAGEEATPVIRKPFTPAALTRKIREVMATPA